MARNAIVIGETRFRDIVMDYNPIFRVLEDMGNGTYRAVSEDEMGYGGVERFYSCAQVLAHVRHMEALEAMFESQANFWSTRAVGEVLHYHNGFGEFVRGTVIEADGKKLLKPTALVGKWGKYDLPYRSPNGEIVYPYHADKVINGGPDACWQPNESCVYEAPEYARQSEGDPSTMPAIDLTVPDMTPEEQETANLEQALDRVRKILENRYQTSAPPREVLAAIEDEVRGFNGF